MKNPHAWMIGMVAMVVADSQALAQAVIAEPGEHRLANTPFALGLPDGDGPVTIQASFQLQDLNRIDDEAETIEFSGVLILRWRDGRQAFDPAEAGTNEKIYQGDYQFNEVFPGWYPQAVLVNSAGSYERHGVILRVAPDGTHTLVERLNAAAKAELDMWRFPFDRQRLEWVFEVLGLRSDEVVMQIMPEAARSIGQEARIPQWTLGDVDLSIGERSAACAGQPGTSSTFVVSVEAQRRPFFIVRLVMIPLALIVVLSFSVFWMDRSSLGDRINVSFIGILTGVAYQIVMSDFLPHISYFTLMNGFLNLSFLTMCATVVVNLFVGGLVQQGRHDLVMRLDRRCRWLFPLVYFGLVAVMFVVAFL